MKIALALLILLLATAARSDGIYNPSSASFVGTNGINSPTVTSSVTTCSGTGLKFNIACNSQYVGLL